MLQYTYLAVNLACISIPLLASFYAKRPFCQYWSSFFYSSSLVASVFLVWDIDFTHRGVWGFNPQYLIGIDIGNLPLEEVLFFFCIPYACTFSFFAMKYLVPSNPLQPYSRYITTVLIAVCLYFMSDPAKLYSFVTGLLTLLFLIYCSFKNCSLADYYGTYLLVLPFFFMSNGILTGFGLVEPVVWYDNTRNIAVRLGTIPVEDLLYGFLLIGLNLNLFKWFSAIK